MKRLLLFAGFLALQAVAIAEQPIGLAASAVIPRPVSIVSANGSFQLTGESAVVVSGDSAELQRIGRYLAKQLNPATGFGIEVKPADGNKSAGNIYLSLGSTDPQLGDEGYQLTITPDAVSLVAGKPAGLFHGIQTIRQLLPAGIEMSSRQPGPWEIPAGTIRDFPAYSFRGAMLDVARHFFQVDDVKRYIDLIAAYKMNVLHLHLADDQGWRIEIKKWPALTAIGGSTQVGGGKGGFYTQEQYAGIVKYAAERYITIIPEIDMPGHINAALASYPELNDNDKATELYTGCAVGFSALRTAKPVTLRFIADVLGELASLTPGPYLHIGGDEAHKVKPEEYVPFINKVQDIVNAAGKQMIGWDPVAQSSLKPGTIVQHYQKEAMALQGVKKGAKVIMSPDKRAYLDIKYDSTTKLGLDYCGHTEVDKAYNWKPAAWLAGIGKENILGVEAPLWSETVTNMDEVEYMAFPRLPGYAEIGWRAPATPDWEEYKTRLGRHGARFKALGIDYYPSKLVPWSALPSGTTAP